MTPARPRRPGSLRKRLAALFAAFAGGWLLLVGVAVDRAVALHFDELDRDELQARGQIVERLVAAAERLPDAAGAELLDAVRDATVGLAVRHKDDAGARLLIDETVFDALSAAQRQRLDAGDAVRWTTAGRAFLGHRQTPGPTDTAPARPPVRGAAPDTPSDAEPDAAMAPGLLVALDVSHHTHFQQRARLALLLAVLLAALGAYLIGSLAARRGLKPLTRVAATARGLSVDGLDARLPLDDAPREVAELITEFNAMLGRLERGFERLREFSADIAHELRTPVSNLMTETAVALSRTRDPDEYRDTLASNHEEFERLSRMISDLLFLAKTEHGAGLVQIERVDLVAEVAALFEFYEALAETRSLNLVCEVSTPPHDNHTARNRRRSVATTPSPRAGSADTSAPKVTVRGDRSMLRRALSNLLSNALRHATPGTSVRVWVAAGSRAAIDVAHRPEVQIMVLNEGETIDPQRLPHLFERFYRAGAERSQHGEGAGLGLAITRSIVLAHRGHIDASSDAGTTVFTITLPADDAPAAGRHQPRAHDAHRPPIAPSAPPR